MDDLISRQEVLTKLREAEYIGTLKDEGGYIQRHRDFMEMYEIIRDIPSAQKWTLCSKRLPEKDGRYWAWCEIFIVPDHVDDPCSYYGSREASYLGGHWYGDSIGEVVAWMELPEAWKGSEDKEC